MNITLTNDKTGRKSVKLDTDNIRALYQDTEGKTVVVMNDETTVYVRESVEQVNTMMRG